MHCNHYKSLTETFECFFFSSLYVNSFHLKSIPTLTLIFDNRDWIIDIYIERCPVKLHWDLKCIVFILLTNPVTNPIRFLALFGTSNSYILLFLFVGIQAVMAWYIFEQSQIHLQNMPLCETNNNFSLNGKIILY